ncbi:unnamed protein product [Caenorhabditis angaria]|uniref:Uncharacterized protein n=1 Tax=Caenorhabditis angaria TaxID=860376 RepID=A0A9P1N0V1_9PELO|nr:unnamed protein product [Caenorhabditis angaria]
MFSFVFIFLFLAILSCSIATSSIDYISFEEYIRLQNRLFEREKQKQKQNQQITSEPYTLFTFNSTWRCNLNQKWNATIYFYQHDENGSNNYLVDYKFIELTHPSYSIKSYARQEKSDVQNDVRVAVYHNCEKDGNYMKFIEKIEKAEKTGKQQFTMRSDINIDNKGDKIDEKYVAKEWVDVKL